MREYKFRGKRIDNGEWIYGSLLDGDIIVSGRVDVDGDYIGISEWCSVEIETVGQYTGLNDKNGKEIYEGDIYHLGDKRILSVVEWHDSGFMGKQIGTYGSREGLQHWRDQIEIIGNIYESPAEVTP